MISLYKIKSFKKLPLKGCTVHWQQKRAVQCRLHLHKCNSCCIFQKYVPNNFYAQDLITEILYGFLKKCQKCNLSWPPCQLAFAYESVPLRGTLRENHRIRVSLTHAQYPFNAMRESQSRAVAKVGEYMLTQHNTFTPLHCSSVTVHANDVSL